MKIHVVAIWEHEIRAAAKAIAEVRRVLSEIEAATSDDERKERNKPLNDAAWSALDACAAAMAGVEDESAAITICSLPKPMQRTRKR